MVAPTALTSSTGPTEAEEPEQRWGTNSGDQQATAIAKLEEQLKAAKSENKRVAAKAQQNGKAKDAVGEPEDGCDEEEADNLDELQTLVDLSTKHFL